MFGGNELFFVCVTTGCAEMKKVRHAKKWKTLHIYGNTTNKSKSSFPHPPNKILLLYQNIAHIMHTTHNQLYLTHRSRTLMSQRKSTGYEILLILTILMLDS